MVALVEVLRLGVRRPSRLESSTPIIAAELENIWFESSRYKKDSDRWKYMAAEIKKRWAPVVLLLFVFMVGCVSPLDLARKDFAASLRVANAAQMRLRTWDAQRQAEIVRTAKDRAEGQLALEEYRARRQRVLEVAKKTEAIMDAVADDLLLGSGGEATQAAERARRAAQELRQEVANLQEGVK